MNLLYKVGYNPQGKQVLQVPTLSFTMIAIMTAIIFGDESTSVLVNAGTLAAGDSG